MDLVGGKKRSIGGVGEPQGQEGKLSLEINSQAVSGKGDSILRVEDDPAATSDDRGGGLDQLSNDLAFPLAELFFPASDKDLWNGMFCGLDDSFIGIDERHGEFLREEGADRAFA